MNWIASKLGLFAYLGEFWSTLIQLTVSILTFRFSLGAHFNWCISPLPKCANIGAEGRLRTLSVPHIIALYESFVVRTGSTDADLRLRFGDVHLIFFPCHFFFLFLTKK